MLHGTIGEPGRWHAAVEAAEIDSRRKYGVWALASLAELYLLAPLAGQAARAEVVCEVLEELKCRATDFPGDDAFILETMACQWRRYTEWWTTANGFFPGGSDLAAEAGRLTKVLLQ